MIPYGVSFGRIEICNQAVHTGLDGRRYLVIHGDLFDGVTRMHRWLSFLGDKAYDFMLIDGAHKIRYVTQDLRWLRLLKPGGVACIHDYNDRHEGVKLSVDRFLRKYPNYRREQLVGSLMILRKSGPSLAKEVAFADSLWASAFAPFLQLKINLRKRLARSA
jgi:UDP-2,3-diacylglucosamine pyrophosphatase LpxH